jgi:hypothetical protein
MLAAEWGLGDLMWTMVALFFWLMAIVIFVMVFADIFRRDMSGWAKAGWILVIFVLPLFGALIYLIVHPRIAGGGARGSAGYSEGSSATSPMGPGMR